MEQDLLKFVALPGVLQNVQLKKPMLLSTLGCEMVGKAVSVKIANISFAFLHLLQCAMGFDFDDLI